MSSEPSSPNEPPHQAEQGLTRQQWLPLQARARSSALHGISDYFSSCEEAICTQYKQINYLLGTEGAANAHSGTLCEVLIRDFLRKHLPRSLSVDKGFIHGKAVSTNGEEKSCPEVDILIHENARHAELFRIDDFVVVHPNAVRGVIQVKKRLDQGKLKSAFENLFWSAAIPHTLCSGWAKVFVGVIAFYQEGLGILEAGALSLSYESALRERYAGDPQLLPHFVGTLRDCYLRRVLDDHHEHFTNTFEVYDSRFGERWYTLYDMLIQLRRAMGELRFVDPYDQTIGQLSSRLPRQKISLA